LYHVHRETRLRDLRQLPRVAALCYEALENVAAGLLRMDYIRSQQKGLLQEFTADQQRLLKEFTAGILLYIYIYVPRSRPAS